MRFCRHVFPEKILSDASAFDVLLFNAPGCLIAAPAKGEVYERYDRGHIGIGGDGQVWGGLHGLFNLVPDLCQELLNFSSLLSRKRQNRRAGAASIVSVEVAGGLDSRQAERTNHAASGGENTLLLFSG